MRDGGGSSRPLAQPSATAASQAAASASGTAMPTSSRPRNALDRRGGEGRPVEGTGLRRVGRRHRGSTAWPTGKLVSISASTVAATSTSGLITPAFCRARPAARIVSFCASPIVE